MRYKTVGLLLAISLAATMTACGDGGTDNDDNEQTTPPAQQNQVTPSPGTDDGGEGGEG